MYDMLVINLMQAMVQQRRPTEGLAVIKIYPKLDDDLLVKLFHKGARSHWTAADVDWAEPLLFNPKQANALARILTPVYLGEQSAMIGASVALPQMAAAGETTSQLYLSSFLMDEARHFEVLTRLYARLDSNPVGLREMPEMLRYHNRLRKGDRVDWVWGILISDIFAKNFYQFFSKSQPDALFGKLSGRILQDESRHQAFAEHYLKRALPSMPIERVHELMKMKDELLLIMDSMYIRLNEDAERIGLNGRDFLDHLRAEVETKAKRIGIDGSDPPEDGGTLGKKTLVRGIDTLKHHAHDITAKFQALTQPQCQSCFLSVLCQSRLLTAATVRH